MNYDKYKVDDIFDAGRTNFPILNAVVSTLRQNFNWLEAFESLVKRADENSSSVWNTREMILHTAQNWRSFNLAEAIKILKKYNETGLIKGLKENYKRGG
jgi:hypothetical protein